TTLKKTLASFITLSVLQPPSTSALVAELNYRLLELRLLSEHLLDSVYPFSSLEEFEGFRQLAYNDLPAAQSRLLLRRSSSSRSVMRIYYGPPGTGKTLAAVRHAVALADPHHSGDVDSFFRRFNELSR